MTLDGIQLVFDWPTIVGLLAIAQAACLSIYLSIFHYKEAAYWCLNVLIFSILVALGHDVLIHSKLAVVLPQFIGFGPFSTYLSGPLVWLLALKLTQPDKPLTPIHLLHFLPFMAHFISRWNKYFDHSDNKLEFIIRYFNQNPNANIDISRNFDLNTLGQIVYFYGHRFIYIILALIVLYHHRAIFQHAMAARIQFYRLIWWGLSGYCVIWLIVNIASFIPLTASVVETSRLTIHALSLSCVVIISAIILLRHHSEQIFSTKSTKKYQQSGLEKSTAQQIIAQIDQLMQQQQLFCDGQLKISQLAGQMGLSTQLISQAINSELNLSFNDYINNLRLEHIKNALKQMNNKNVDIQQLALASGFNSKATFYRVFKEKVGMTPNAYRKQNLLSE